MAGGAPFAINYANNGRDIDKIATRLMFIDFPGQVIICYRTKLAVACRFFRLTFLFLGKAVLRI